MKRSHGLYVVKKSYWIIKNWSKWVFRLMNFPEFKINHESQWEFQFIMLKILGHHNQGWPRNDQRWPSISKREVIITSILSKFV